MQTNGTQTVSVDEATGWQALERPAENKPARPGQVAKQEYECRLGEANDSDSIVVDFQSLAFIEPV